MILMSLISPQLGEQWFRLVDVHENTKACIGCVANATQQK